MGNLSHLKPANVWKHFENICDIPHPSYHEEEVAQYVIDEAGKLGFDTRRDEVGNVVVTVPATSGLEKAPIIVLQGHLDMVPVSAPGVEFDFEKDSLITYVDGDYVRAKGTTLGADNGIGVAIMLAMMEDKDIEHGPLELLCTVNEESGMDGAHGLKAEFVKGRYLINLDTEEWGEYYISCAGGGDSNITLPVVRIPLESGELVKNNTILELSVGGLKGGHSGIDINAGRGSGNKIIARCLAEAASRTKFNIVSLEGGNKRNSVSDSAVAIIALAADNAVTFKDAVNSMAKTIIDEFEKTDPGLTVRIDDFSGDLPSDKPMSFASTETIINLLIALPHGVITMSAEVDGLVETSTNLGVMNTKGDNFLVTLLTRSAVTSHLPAVKGQIKTIAALTGATVEEPRGYPGWKPDMDSTLLRVGSEVFRGMHNEEPAVKAIHAGLECGLFSEKLPGVDMLSIGPEMHNVHSPDEELHHPSVPKTYDLLAAIIRAMAD